VTSAAGFIGFHVASALAATQHSVCGVDNFNDCYDVKLKHVSFIKLLILTYYDLFIFFPSFCRNRIVQRDIAYRQNTRKLLTWNVTYLETLETIGRALQVEFQVIKVKFSNN